MADQASGQIDSVMQETRLFPPTKEFAAQAADQFARGLRKNVARGGRRRRGLLGRTGQRTALVQAVHKVLEWNEPFAKWFVGGQTMPATTASMAPRQLRDKTRRRSSGKASRATRATLPTSSCTARFASSPTCSKSSASRTGDVVSIYMPMVPELAIAMLACARIGAVHSRDLRRLFRPKRSPTATTTPRPSCIITADYGWRRGQQLPLKANVDAALEKSPTVKNCIVLAARRQPRATCKPAATCGGTN